MFSQASVILSTVGELGVGGSGVGFPACITGYMTRGVCLQRGLPLGGWGGLHPGVGGLHPVGEGLHGGRAGQTPPWDMVNKPIVVHPVTQLVLCGIWSTACSITYILQP